MFYELPTLMSANLSDRRRDGKGNGKWNVTPANFSLSLSSTDTPRILPREGGQHRSVCTNVYKFDNSFSFNMYNIYKMVAARVCSRDVHSPWKKFPLHNFGDTFLLRLRVSEATTFNK